MHWNEVYLLNEDFKPNLNFLYRVGFSIYEAENMNTTKLSRLSQVLVVALTLLAIAPVLRADSLIYTSAVDITNYQLSWLYGFPGSDYLYKMQLPNTNSFQIKQGDTLSGTIIFTDSSLTNAASLELANMYAMGGSPLMGIVFTQTNPGGAVADESFTITPTNVISGSLDFSTYTNTDSYVGELGVGGYVGIPSPGVSEYGFIYNSVTFGGFNYSIDVTNLTDTASYIPDYIYFQLAPAGGGFNGDGSAFPSDGNSGGDVLATPEPSSFVLLAIGGLLLGGYAWRKKQRTA